MAIRDKSAGTVNHHNNAFDRFIFRRALDLFQPAFGKWRADRAFEIDDRNAIFGTVVTREVLLRNPGRGIRQWVQNEPEVQDD